MTKSTARQTLRTVILRWRRNYADKRELRAELAAYDEAFATIDALSTREDAMTLAARAAQLGVGPREFEEMANHWYRCRCPGSAWPGHPSA